MTYRRQSVLRAAGQGPTPPPPPPIVIAQPGSTANVLALGMLVATIVGLVLLHLFNQWQQQNARDQDAAMLRREAQVALQSRRDSCIAIAAMGTQVIRQLPPQQALQMMRVVEGYDPRCAEVGVNVGAAMAAAIAREPGRYPRAARDYAERVARAPRPGVDIDALGGPAYYLDLSDTDIAVPPATDDGSAAVDRFVTDTGIRQRNFTGADGAPPRLNVGLGVSWNSVMGPLRFDIASAAPSRSGDPGRLVTFSPATQF